MSIGSAAGCWIETDYDPVRKFQPRLVDGKIVFNWTIEAFQRCFPPKVLAHDINIKWILKLMAGRYIEYASDIKSYEFKTDGVLIKIFIELDDGVQPDTKVNREGEAVSGPDEKQSANASMDNAGPEEVSVPNP